MSTNPIVRASSATAGVVMPVVALGLSLGLALGGPSTALAETGPVTSEPPASFSRAWDSPRTADAPVQVPNTQHCSVTLFDDDFANWDTHKKAFTPPTGCGTEFNTVVLKLQGSVKGVQYDRLGWVDVNDVRLLTFSTPEPNDAGITWQAERDVTDKLPLLDKPGTATMNLGNTVNESYTGVFHIRITLDFYRTGKDAPKASVADSVGALQGSHRDGPDVVGTTTVAPNTTRWTSEVYATGSGGGNEEFWDLNAPASTGYPDGTSLPWREVQVLVDGRLAGTALPYPYIWTGGWSNPYLWANIPSPGAFAVAPMSYDLTPFIGLVHDGKPHEVRLKVAGVPRDSNGWTLSGSFNSWVDAGRQQVPAGFVQASTNQANLKDTLSGDAKAGRVELDGTQQFSATGWVGAGDDKVTTTVKDSLANTSDHQWADEANSESLDARWNQQHTVTRTDARGASHVWANQSVFTKKGSLTAKPIAGTEGGQDITTTLAITRQNATTIDGKPAGSQSDKFNGTATWNAGVPRNQRKATAKVSHEHHTVRADGSTFDRTLVAENGRFSTDSEEVTGPTAAPSTPASTTPAPTIPAPTTPAPTSPAPTSPNRPGLPNTGN